MAGTRQRQPARRSIESATFGVLDVVAMQEDDDKRLELCVDKTRTRAVLYLSVFAPPVDIAMTDISPLATEGQVLLNSDAAAQVQKVLQSLQGVKRKELEILLFESPRPTDGESGRLEWLIDYDHAGQFSVDERGKADYRNLNTIVNVKAGEKVLLVRNPTKGVPGMDVYGASLPARDGDTVRIRRGRNLAVEETGEGTVYTSEIDGMVSFDKDMISVESEVTIAGDVDLSVGNIDFVGPINIAKGVLDGFSIKGGDVVTVNGLVEAATLESAGDMKCLGGVQGKLKGQLKCGGKLEAKYLNEARVECEGDVIVTKSVVNTKMRTLGKMIVETEGVVGSDISALHGLETPVLGSDLCIPTKVTVGVHHRLQSQLDALRKELEGILKESEKLQYNIGPYLTNPKRLDNLVPKRKEKIVTLIVELRNMLRRRDEIKQQTAQLEADLKQCSREAYVLVAKMLYGGIDIRVGPFRRVLSESVKGPVKLVADYQESTVTLEKG